MPFKRASSRGKSASKQEGSIKNFLTKSDNENTKDDKNETKSDKSPSKTSDYESDSSRSVTPNTDPSRSNSPSKIKTEEKETAYSHGSAYAVLPYFVTP